MKFLADESVDYPIVSHLKSEGIDIVAISDMAPGIVDSEALKIANDQDRILITMDKDFGDLVYRLKQAHVGVILVRLDSVPPNVKIEKLFQLIKERNLQLENSFTVLQENLVRVRS